ncbi:ATP-dependent helicase HrpB [Nereida sp. MMG025]|uniref:ATP-dependent helicase HrpB n=1 Tax=Nereida sp. MMG025 TaxID=2909981 RepID=UPI001EFF625A|nr:ATP-dependent helicase HrpB [Nereida sp. MMG025]MCF6444031.1 ATP-dependent helicase HrpB [Nereida sp. MMG025]
MALPIDPILPQLGQMLTRDGVVVLQAPPGAGKTTRVPLALRGGHAPSARMIMLEPRRLAAKAAAERLAAQLGERVGQTVGYRMRGATEVGPDTVIEVVTEGILTRILQNDPEMAGYKTVIFDEFHERSLHADLGLALISEVRAALRDDLQIVVMSATLDAGPVAELLGAKVLTSEGRAFPVETVWLDRPLGKDRRFEAASADLVAKAVEQTRGGVLVFLPGEGEIRRVQRLLDDRLPKDCAIRPLFGAMPFDAQRAAIMPPSSGRKVVLATSIAETSLTIEDIRVVVDCGKARRARFDAGSGMSRLVTERVTRAEATQRAGRAGRVAQGVCYKLWTKGEEGAMQAFPPAEIEAADLANFALELAQWGAAPHDLPFLTPPPEGAMQGATDLLTFLGALENGRLTEHGKELARLPLHPRLGHMVLRGGGDAAEVAALLSERDVLDHAGSDMALRLRALRGDKTGRINTAALKRVKSETQRLRRLSGKDREYDLGQLLALAYPDRIGIRRKGDSPRYLLSGGKGALFDAGDDLGTHPIVVACDLDGNPKEARIRKAAVLSEAGLREVFGARIGWHHDCTWSKREGRVLAVSREKIGAAVLQERRWSDASDEAISRAMCDGIRQIGLRLPPKAQRLQARVALARAGGTDLPDLSDERLQETLEDWLLPYLKGITTTEQWKAFDPLPALKARLTWEQTQELDAQVPSHFTSPLGNRVPIDYSTAQPAISLRLQEMFGTTRHPTVGGAPLLITLLSPAQKPLQTTADIPGFWAGSYADVRKDMRARYPKHPWPEDPTQADPTLRAKPRKR